ncbi:MAG TPA: flagellar M-ring protein FliF C-terminal domain-containing protein, partial [Rubrivivax sp.]|nr:flagellar M-ring protein FliF C-terminal domain-containing protein [Rubrivivax sp.]
RSNTDAKGKTTVVPLSDKELEQLTALVQQGIGFNSERGDVVKVINAPFRVEAPPAADDTPLWKQGWLVDLLKSAAAPVALALVALVIVTRLIKPALTAVLTPPPPPPGSTLNEVVDEAPVIGPPQLQSPQSSDKLLAARALAKQNPAAVAHIVRTMVNGEAS